jgi:hypothetical protein
MVVKTRFALAFLYHLYNFCLSTVRIGLGNQTGLLDVISRRGMSETQRSRFSVILASPGVSKLKKTANQV